MNMPAKAAVPEAVGSRIKRFQGDDGVRRLEHALLEHRLVGNAPDIRDFLLKHSQLLEASAGDTIIKQDDFATDVFLIIAGSLDIQINGKLVAKRGPGDYVGEMAAIEPSQPRSASVQCTEVCVLLRISETDLTLAGNQFPVIWRRLAAGLSRKLQQRGSMVSPRRETVKLFVMSSVEAIPIGNLLIRHFAHDRFLTVAWHHGVFRASNYALEDLEQQLDDSDFAVAIAHADDLVISRENEWSAVRDNVLFELGMFMGRLGRKRTVLLEPRKAGIRLPSDFAGLTTIGYQLPKGADAMAVIAPACCELRDHITRLGPRE